MPSIKINLENYQKLKDLKHDLAKATGKDQSMNSTIQYLLERLARDDN